MMCKTLSMSDPSPLDLPVVYKVSVLPPGPLWPCVETYMCQAGPLCFQRLFHTVSVDLSEWGKFPWE